MAVQYYNDPFKSPYGSSFKGFQSGYTSGPDYSKYPGQGNQGSNQGSWFEKNRGFLNFLGGLFEGVGNFFGSRSERKQRESELEFEREKFRAEQARRAEIARQILPYFQELGGMDFSSIGGRSFRQPQNELRALISGS
jgi:hypothetical protein